VAGGAHHGRAARQTSTGLKVDIKSLLTARGIGLAALFLALLLVAHGASALLWYRDLGRRDTASLALFAATGLRLIVACVTVGGQRGAISASVGASLVGARVVSVLTNPLLATAIAARGSPAAAHQTATG
jgi:Kef-type K+ transport system membrane component KefB